MHPYLESLKLMRDKRYENFYAEERLGPILGTLGLALGVANSFAYQYTPFWSTTSSVLCAIIGYGIGMGVTDCRNTRAAFKFIDEHKATLDNRAYDRWKLFKPFDQLPPFTPAEIDQIAREALQNNLVHGIRNALIKLNLPNEVLERVAEIEKNNAPAIQR